MKKTFLLFTFLPLLYSQTASYPGSVVTDSQLKIAVNNVQTTLNAPMMPGDTAIVVVSGTGFVPNMLVSVDTEIIAICQVVGNILTIGNTTCPNANGRGFDGTIAAAHAATAKVSGFVDAWHSNAKNKEIEAIETALGANLANVAQLTGGVLPISLGGTNASTQATALSNILGASAVPIANGGTGATSQGAALTAVLGGSPLSIANGGTGQITQGAALTALLGASSVPIANGGTGQTTQAGALTALLASSVIPIANGGTNATTQAAALSNILGASTVPTANGGTGQANLTSLPLVTPKVTVITDANGNPFIRSNATGSAVDSLTVVNAAAANPATVTLQTSGTDANINFSLIPSGTGKVNLGSTSATVDTAGNLTVVGCTGCGSGSTITGFDTPELHGCAGNGTTDDTACFQAALTAVDGTGKTLWASQKYKITGSVSATVGNFTLTGNGTLLITAGVSGTARLLLGSNTTSTTTTTTTNLTFAGRFNASNNTIGVASVAGLSVGQMVELQYCDVWPACSGSYDYFQDNIIQGISGTNVTFVDPIVIPLLTAQTSNVVTFASVINNVTVRSMTFDCTNSSASATVAVGLTLFAATNAMVENVRTVNCNAGSFGAGLWTQSGHGNYFAGINTTNSGSVNLDAITIWRQSHATGTGFMATGKGDSATGSFGIGFHFNVGSAYSNIQSQGHYNRNFKLLGTAYSTFSNVVAGNSFNATNVTIAFGSYRNSLVNVSCSYTGANQPVGVWFDATDAEWNTLDGVNCFGNSTGDIQFNSGNHNNQVLNASYSTLSDNSADVSNRVTVRGGEQYQSRTGCSGTVTASVTLVLNYVGTTACTNTTYASDAIISATTAGYIQNLRVTSGTAGVNGSSGVVTIYNGASPTTVTCTIGTLTTCNDTAHRSLVAPGDSINARVTTQGADTLADIQVSFEF